MGFIKIHESLAGKVFVGERAVGGIYVGDERVYPSITGVDTGVDADQWSYTDPTRTRTLHLWEQDLYADGSRGEKRYTGTSTETQTAAVATGWDGSAYWNGACGSNYNYVDYKKVRTEYAYEDITRYGDWRNGDSRSRRVDGQCGWVRAWRVSADWANTGSTCNSAGTVGQYNCDGTYTVKYHQQRRTLSYCYPDMSGSTQTKTEYRVGSVASRSHVNGQCGYNPKKTIFISLDIYNSSPNQPIIARASEAVASLVTVTANVTDIDGRTYELFFTFYQGMTTGGTTSGPNDLRVKSAEIVSISPTEDSTCRYEIACDISLRDTSYKIK